MKLDTLIWSGFHSKTLRERQDQLRLMLPHLLSNTLERWPIDGLGSHVADKMVENCIGTLGLPLGLAVHFVINGVTYAIPMATEEASVIAAASYGAKTIAQFGDGFHASVQSDTNTLVTQILLTGLSARQQRELESKLAEHKDRLCQVAEQYCPQLVKRGGGMRDLYCRTLHAPTHPNKSSSSPHNNSNHHRRCYEPPNTFFVVHLVFDVQEVMGANITTVVAEHLATDIIALCQTLHMTHARAGPCIVSDLNTERLTQAEFFLPVDCLAHHGVPGRVVAQRMVDANAWAACDPWRAVTHNKGILNGIDAAAMATGQDWRAIEAACHAFPHCPPSHAGLVLTHYAIVESSSGGCLLHGRIRLPLLVGVQGALTKVHPAVHYTLGILGFPDARTLSMVLASLGLAQSFAALRALATEGIARGHMALHARHVALSVGSPLHLIDEVTAYMRAVGTMSAVTAREYLQALDYVHRPQDSASFPPAATPVAHLKVHKGGLVGTPHWHQPCVFVFREDSRRPLSSLMGSLRRRSSLIEEEIAIQALTLSTEAWAQTSHPKSHSTMETGAKTSYQSQGLSFNITFQTLGSEPLLLVMEKEKENHNNNNKNKKESNHASLSWRPPVMSDLFDEQTYTEIVQSITLISQMKLSLRENVVCRLNEHRQMILKLMSLLLKSLVKRMMSRYPHETRCFIKYCCHSVFQDIKECETTTPAWMDTNSVPEMSDTMLSSVNTPSSPPMFDGSRRRRSHVFRISKVSMQDLLSVENEDMNDAAAESQEHHERQQKERHHHRRRHEIENGEEEEEDDMEKRMRLARTTTSPSVHRRGSLSFDRDMRMSSKRGEWPCPIPSSTPSATAAMKPVVMTVPPFRKRASHLNLNDNNEKILEHIRREYYENDTLLVAFPLILSLWQVFEIRVHDWVGPGSRLSRALLDELRAVFQSLVCFHPVHDSIYEFSNHTEFMMQHIKSTQFTLYYLIEAMSLQDGLLSEEVIQDIVKMAHCLEWEATLARDTCKSLFEKDQRENYANAVAFWLRTLELDNMPDMKASYDARDLCWSPEKIEPFLVSMAKIRRHWCPDELNENSLIFDVDRYEKTLTSVKQYYATTET